MDTSARRDATLVGADGSLSRLLQTEALLAERLAAAEAEAVRIRAAAVEATRAADATLGRDLDAAVATLEREFAERRSARLAELESEKTRRVEALRALPDAMLDRLAGELVERVLDLATEGAS